MIAKKKTSTAHELISDIDFCVFDLETTGGNHQNDKVIEIGLVKIRNLKITETKDFLINPEIDIPIFIQKLTTITPGDLEHSPTIEEVIDEILEFMGDSVLVAHNTSFDVPFFDSVLTRLNRPILKNKSICTNLMTTYLIPNLLNSNLNYMSKIFGIMHRKAHRALDDALATSELLLKYLNIYINKDIPKINHLYYPKNKYELDRTHFKNKDQEEKIIKSIHSVKCPFFTTIKGENGLILFAFPSNNGVNENKFLINKLKEIEWKTVTIQLFGSLIETIIQFNNFFSKLDPTCRGEAIDFLWEEHLKCKRPVTHEEEHDLPLKNGQIGDFLIVNHLVPDQFVIYPILTMHSKSKLIFRYPGHKKKLLQYINSKITRLKNNKLKPTHYHPMLREFLSRYLEEAVKNSSEIFVFPSKLPQRKQEEFYLKISDFLTKNPPTYNYPKEYI